jgi:hypothetical protein
MAGGMLIAKGYATPDTLSPELLSGVATALVGVAMSAYQKYTAKQELLKAIQLPAGNTEDTVKRLVASGVSVPTVLTPPNTVPGVPK